MRQSFFQVWKQTLMMGVDEIKLGLSMIKDSFKK